MQNLDSFIKEYSKHTVNPETYDEWFELFLKYLGYTVEDQLSSEKEILK